MKELIYSIEDIFQSRTQSSCLIQYSSEFYHIPAYQRGYKWSSSPNGAVDILLNDLWDAFIAYSKQERAEYYLQYITVKPIDLGQKDESVPCLEVIDGQQRLTTLSILLSALSAILETENLSSKKLDYAIRSNFFSKHIYEKEDFEALVKLDWTDLERDVNLNKQDIFYLFSAAKLTYRFLLERKQATLNEFYKFVRTNVKLIVNSVERHTESETVFKNLNSNKVPLTEFELIKGLLITKVGRSVKSPKHYNEILEIRSNLGRQWDEISRWANQPEIKSFYFNNKIHGMHELLKLAAICFEDQTISLSGRSNSSHSLFNRYHQFPNPLKAFDTIKDLYQVLRNWYSNLEIYNLIGYCRFVKGSKNGNLKFLKECFSHKDDDSLLKFLEDTKRSLLPKRDISLLRFGEPGHDEEIHACLLALNVFNEGLKNRFNFHEFIDKNWSLEHVFPQSPEGKDLQLNQVQKESIKEMLGDAISNQVDEILNKEKRTDEEKKIYYQALQAVGDLNSIGNICLLTKGDNSSNGCLFFKEKRENILKLIQKGSFVPKHTFEVFSKMIPDLNSSDLSVWKISDIHQHKQYIKKTLTKELPTHESR